MLRDLNKSGVGRGNGPRRNRLQEKRTKQEQQSDFLSHFTKIGIITAACIEAKVCTASVQYWKMTDPLFAADFEFCKGIVCMQMEDEAMRRAVKGVIKPVFQNGKYVGEITEYSDTLLIFLMKGAMPAKYRDKLEINRGNGASADASVLILPSNGRDLVEDQKRIELPMSAYSTFDPNHPIPEIVLRAENEKEENENGELGGENGIDLDELDLEIGESDDKTEIK